MALRLECRRVHAHCSVSVTFGSTTLSATADGSGNWSRGFTSAQIPTDGSYSISATASDAAGNSGSAGTRSVTVDTTAPSVAISAIAGDDRINDSEDNSAVAVRDRKSVVEG